MYLYYDFFAYETSMLYRADILQKDTSRKHLLLSVTLLTLSASCSSMDLVKEDPLEQIKTFDKDTRARELSFDDTEMTLNGECI